MGRPVHFEKPEFPKGLLIAGAIVLAVGLLVGAVLFFWGVAGLTDAFDARHSIQGGTAQTIELDGGEWWFFGEGPTRGLAAQSTMMLTDANGIDLTNSLSRSTTYRFERGIHFKESIGSLEVSAGEELTVTVRATGPSNTSIEVERVSLLPPIVRLIVGVLIAVLGGVVGTVLLLVGWFRRRRARRVWSSKVAPPPPPPPAPPTTVPTPPTRGGAPTPPPPPTS